MDETTRSPGPGGFLIPSLPSPSPSSTSTQVGPGLPQPRAHALRAGSVKEDKVRKYVEARILHISRRYVKKFGVPDPSDEVTGYKTMGELCKDLDAVIDVLWLSGTPSLQIPYFLNVANEFITWVASFAPSPKATFAVLRKLDHCFASLLGGEDIKTKETLPGFEQGLRGGLSRTDMVRCKSIVEQTRVSVVDAMSRGEPDDEDEDESDAPIETEGESAAESGAPAFLLDDDNTVDMDAARVYENTLVKLGEVLGDGMVLDDS